MEIIRGFVLCVMFTGALFAHCQVPCGIYDDARRILQIEEHLTTVERAMNSIRGLSEGDDFQSKNQLIRWVNTKENYAQKIQNIVSEYFLTQRIVPVKSSNTEYNDYVKQTTLLQKILVSTMKCKQTVDSDYLIKTQKLLDEFVAVYFDEHGLKHLKQLRSN